MSYEQKRSPLRKVFAIFFLLGVLPFVVPTFFGIWLPDIMRGDLAVVELVDTTHRILRFKLVQRLQGPDGYTRVFYYTINDKQWFSMPVGVNEPKLWNSKIESSSDYKSLKIFDRGQEKIRIEWSSQMDRYVWVKSNGSIINSSISPARDPG
jgi:hypothetical protein